ncbi:MAG TPA: HAD family hydrolase [Candidatus Limnocylindrales bacterium]|nr:HAD family hydrolase [Candidatus Limnocylindrales bacterium]
MRLFDRSRPSRQVQRHLRDAAAWAFDWDGTILDSMGRTLAVYTQLFSEFGITFGESDFRAHYSPAWNETYQRVGLPREAWPAADRRWVQLYETEIPSLVEGAAEAVRELAANGVALALVTAGHRARVELELRANGLADVFTTAVYGDAVPRQKPDPAPLQLAAKYLRVEPASLVYVGDATDDMTMAKRAGALPIGVGSGAAEPKRLKAAGARWIAPSLGALVRLAGRAP